MTQGRNDPITGTDFLAARLAGGISRYAVAQQMGEHVETVRRWEMERGPVPTPRAKRWRGALTRCARTRQGVYERLGIDTAALDRGTAIIRHLMEAVR